MNKHPFTCDCKCLSHNGFLTAKGLREAAQRDVNIDGLDNMDMFGYLDRSGSVSGLELERDFHVFDDALLDQQHRRFLSGS